MGAGIGNIADYLSQSGGAADVASGAAGFSEMIPILGALAELGISINDIVSGKLGSGIGTLLLGPLGGLFGNFLQDAFTGVPKGAKTSGAASTLQSSGDPLSADLGKFIASAGGGQDSNVLSNPAFAHETNSMADVLTWLSGKALPGWKPMGSTGEIAGIKPPSGAPYSKDVNIMGVQSPEQMAGILGKSPNLTPAQINAILPQLMELAKSPGTVASMKGAIDPLVTTAEKTPADITAYMNQGGSGLKFPGLSSEGSGGGGNILNILPLLLAGGGGFLSNLFNFSSNNGDSSGQGGPQGRLGLQQNILNAFMAPHGAALGYNPGTAPRFGPLPG